MSNPGNQTKKPLIRETDQNREWLRTLKFTLFSISAGVIQIGTYALFTECSAGHRGWLTWSH